MVEASRVIQPPSKSNGARKIQTRRLRQRPWTHFGNPNARKIMMLQRWPIQSNCVLPRGFAWRGRSMWIVANRYVGWLAKWHSCHPIRGDADFLFHYVALTTGTYPRLETKAKGAGEIDNIMFVVHFPETSLSTNAHAAFCRAVHEMMMMGAIVPDLEIERTVNKFTLLLFLDAWLYVLFEINLL